MKTIPDELDLGSKIRYADIEARCWVQGAKRCSVQGVYRLVPIPDAFHPRLLEHRLVQDSLKEGWHHFFRRYLIFKVTRLVLRGDRDIETLSVAELMPHVSDIEQWRLQARKEIEGVAWRARVTDSHGSVDNYLSRSTKNGGKTFRSVRPPTAARSPISMRYFKSAVGLTSGSR